MKRMHKNAKRSAATPSAVVSLALLTHSWIGTNRKFPPKKRHSASWNSPLCDNLEEINKNETICWNESGTSGLGAGWFVGSSGAARPVRHFYLPSLFISNNHHQTIVTEDLWNQEYQMCALNIEVPFHLNRSGKRSGIGPRVSFYLIFVISWIISFETNHNRYLTTWSRRRDRSMIAGRDWGNPALSLSFFCFVLINDDYYSINCLWMTTNQHGEAWFPFLGPWRPL